MKKLVSAILSLASSLVLLPSLSASEIRVQGTKENPYSIRCDLDHGQALHLNGKAPAIHSIGAQVLPNDCEFENKGEGNLEFVFDFQAMERGEAIHLSKSSPKSLALNAKQKKSMLKFQYDRASTGVADAPLNIRGANPSPKPAYERGLRDEFGRKDKEDNSFGYSLKFGEDDKEDSKAKR